MKVYYRFSLSTIPAHGLIPKCLVIKLITKVIEWLELNRLKDFGGSDLAVRIQQSKPLESKKKKYYEQWNILAKK